MPLIKPRTRGKEMVRLITRLDRENHDALEAYAEFIGETAEYVLNELIDGVLAKDKDFVKWRASQAEPSPRPGPVHGADGTQSAGARGSHGSGPKSDTPLAPGPLTSRPS